MPDSQTKPLSEDLAQSFCIQNHSDEDSIYRGYHSGLSSPYVPPSPVVDRRRWCVYATQSHILPRILGSTDDSADGTDDDLDDLTDRISAATTCVSLPSSPQALSSSRGCSSNSSSSSVRDYSGVFSEEAIDIETEDKTTKPKKGEELDAIDDAIRKERAETLRILTSRADEADDKEAVRSYEGGGYVAGGGQCGKMREGAELGG